MCKMNYFIELLHWNQRGVLEGYSWSGSDIAGDDLEALLYPFSPVSVDNFKRMFSFKSILPVDFAGYHLQRTEWAADFRKRAKIEGFRWVFNNVIVKARLQQLIWYIFISNKMHCETYRFRFLDIEYNNCNVLYHLILKKGRKRVSRAGTTNPAEDEKV